LVSFESVEVVLALVAGSNESWSAIANSGSSSSVLFMKGTKFDLITTSWPFFGEGSLKNKKNLCSARACQSRIILFPNVSQGIVGFQQPQKTPH
jgi:hypothetical protein